MKQFFFLLLVSVTAAALQVKEEERAIGKRGVPYTDIIGWLNEQKPCGSDNECSTTKYCDASDKKVCICGPRDGECGIPHHCCSGRCDETCLCSKKDYPCKLESGDCCDELKCEGLGAIKDGVNYGQCVPK